MVAVVVLTGLRMVLMDKRLEKTIQVEVRQVLATVNAIAARFNTLDFGLSIGFGEHVQLFKNFEQFPRWSFIKVAVDSTVDL